MATILRLADFGDPRAALFPIVAKPSNDLAKRINPGFCSHEYVLLTTKNHKLYPSIRAFVSKIQKSTWHQHFFLMESLCLFCHHYITLSIPLETAMGYKEPFPYDKTPRDRS